MDETLKKFEVLLSHWAKHEHEHAGEYRDWANRVKGKVDQDVYVYVLVATELAEKAAEYFNKAHANLIDR